VRHLDLTLHRPEENLALDEALLDWAEQQQGPGHILRLWESTRPIVVVGRSSRIAVEVDAPRCRRQAIPILRRSSGGAAIVAGPGCLMYAVVLSLEALPHLRLIDRAHAFVLERHLAALKPLCPGIARSGTSDMTLGNRKFSGNSLRIKQRHVLYHGTILYDFQLAWATELLRPPPRQPAYRAGRDHLAFLTNLPAAGSAVRQALIRAWAAHLPAAAWPQDLVDQLVRQRYGLASWHGEF
jgi:lipoate-protein ligase A